MAGLSGAGVFVKTLSIHPVDLIIFLGFLAVTLVVGLSYGQHVKTIRDYALGGKNFTTATLTATIVATWITGGFFFYTIEQTYARGLYYILASGIGGFLSILLTGVVGRRMGSFLDNISVSEAMGSLYGRSVQTITAISGVLNLVGWLAAQFQVITKALFILLNVEGPWVTTIAAIVVIIYSAWGGIRSVTFTDVVQFITFGLAIPTMALTIWVTLPNSNQLVQQALSSTSYFSIKEVVRFTPEFMATIGLMLYFAVPAIAPEVFQRMAMARSPKQVQRSFTYAAAIVLLLKLFLVWIAILLLADNPGLSKAEVVPYVVSNYTYVGLKGLLSIGIIAMAMSSADSFLNSAAILAANDIFRSSKTSNSSRLSVARNASWLLGGAALVLALYPMDLLRLLLLAGSIYLPIVTVPLLLSIFRFRTTSRAVLTGMAAGIITVGLWSVFLDNSDSILPGMIANLLFLLGTHYLLGEPGGWLKIDPNSPLGLEQAARKAAWQNRLTSLKNFKLFAYLKQNLPQQEYIYFFFGLYTVAATYTALYTIGDADIKAYRATYEGISAIVLLITTSFLTYSIWPSKFKNERFIAFFWPLGLGTVLFFAGALLAIMSHFHPLQMVVLMINLLIAVLLLRWHLALFLAFGFITFAFLFFKHVTGAVLSSVAWDTLQLNSLYSLYGLLLFSGVLIVLFKNQNEYEQLGRHNAALHNREKDHQASIVRIATEKQATLAALQYAGVEELLTITRELETMHVAEEEKERMKALQTKLLPIAFHLQGLNTRAQDYLRLQKTEMPLEGWCDEIKAAVVKQGVTARIYCNNKSECEQIQCDPQGLTSLVVHSMVLLNTQLDALEDTPPILFRIEDTQLRYPLEDVKPGYIKYVPAVRIAITISDDLPVVKDSYSAELNGTSQPPTPKTVEELARHANSRIVKSHYGYEEVTDDTLIYVVPVDVEDVRPKDMDQDYMEVGAMPKRANDHFKNEKDGIDAQAQEAAFLADVAARSDANMNMVQTALETIKWYHGPKNRNSGEPFYLHPLTVAHIVLDYNTDEETIIGALLHDTVEDTSMQLEQIEAMFGKATAEVVNLVTHLQSIPHSIYKVKMSSVENLQMLERTGNKKGLYVKIADRMHNMRTIGGHKKIAKRKLIAQETADFFIPLTQKLGLKKATREFEKMCLEVLKQKG